MMTGPIVGSYESPGHSRKDRLVILFRGHANRERADDDQARSHAAMSFAPTAPWCSLRIRTS